MANFTAKDVATLRERTGAGMMDCKKALVAADGDMEKAIVVLREAGMASAAKKEGRIAAEGVVGAFVEGNTGVIVEVNCESDFVSKGEKFHAIVETVAKVIIANKPADVEALNACTVDGVTVKDYITSQTAVIGEKISIRRFEIYQTEGKIETYIHMGGKVGVMVEACPFNGGEEVLHDVALQIAAAKPLYLDEASVPAEVIEKEKEIMIAQMQNDEKFANKPKNVLENIVKNKVGKYYEENCLVKQKFVKDDSKTVAQVVGKNFTIVKFARFEMGEGLAKKNENLADEVAKQVEKMKG